VKEPAHSSGAINCSLACILRVTLPVLFSFLSNSLLYSIDRWILAGYSLDAMNAASISGGLTVVFTMIPIGIAGTAEVFVGQYNGKREFHKLAAPVWQMLYLSLLLELFFLPIAYFSDSLNLLPARYLQDGVEYQRILLAFGSLPSANMALSAFFIGQGRVAVITAAVLLGALVNVVLDYLFIFGWKGIPPLGCQGAAVATVMATAVQVGFLAGLFFSKRHRTLYGTFKNRKYNPTLVLGCIKIGAPASLANLLTMLAWYLVQCAVSNISQEMATIYNVSLTIWALFAFVGDGLNKSVATFSSNMIGQRDLPSIRVTCRTFVILALVLESFVAAFLTLAPEKALTLFHFPLDNSGMTQEIRIVFLLMSTSIVLESMISIFWGILMSGGDSKYPTIVSQTCLWIGVMLPVGILCLRGQLDSVTFVYLLDALRAVPCLFLLYRRYKSLAWYNKIV
jgi:MATE family multidrug resistance protein